MSNRTSTLLRPLTGKRFVRPMSTRVKNGARIRSVRGLQSPAFSSMHVSAVRRRHVAPLGNAQTAVAGRGRRARAERAPRVQDDVVGQHGHEAAARVRGIVDDPELVPSACNSSWRHANEANVAHVDHARLNACRTGELPAADHAVQDRVHVGRRTAGRGRPGWSSPTAS